MLNRKDKPAHAPTATPDTYPGRIQEPLPRPDQVARRIRLDELDRADLRYFLRDQKLLEEDHLRDLLASIQHEGLQSPVEFFQDGVRKVLVKGHRRVAACVILARKGATGFRNDMEIDAFQVMETDEGELLVRSVLDNAVRKNLDQLDRIRVGRRLFLASVPDTRAAEALGISVQSYKRDLSIAEDMWMFEHVEANDINPTPAAALLKAIRDAESTYPSIQLRVRGEVDRWIEQKRREIERRDRVAKAKKGRGRGLSEPDRQVKKYLSNQLAEHWAELIRRGESLDEDARWVFQADYDPEKDTVQVSSVRLDLARDDLRKLVEVASKLSQLAKDIGPALVKRHAEQQSQGRRAGRGGVRDTQYLRDLGLEDFADEYEKELRELAEAGPDGVEDPDFDRQRPRPERDLAEEARATATEPTSFGGGEGGI